VEQPWRHVFEKHVRALALAQAMDLLKRGRDESSLNTSPSPHSLLYQVLEVQL
jgi:hypothetical protein